MENYSKRPFKFVIRSQYFLYFGVLGIFLPYFNLYCYHLGFNGVQIGTLSAFRSVSLVVFPLFWAALADRFHIRRPIYIVCNIFSTLVWILYLYTVDFKIMLIITVVYGVFYAPIISFLEAFTMDILGPEKKSYGSIRVWGSLNFILIVIVLGKMIDLYSIEMILVLILIGSLLQALMSFRVPRIISARTQSFSTNVKTLLKSRVIAFLICGFLMLVSHGAYYGFLSIHLETLGYPKAFIGMAWALASTAEILVMIKSDQIFRRFSLENVLTFSFAAAALRWFILYFVHSPALILFSQIFHAITYGTFHMASILYMDQLTPDKTKTLGQAVNNAVQYGLGLMVGFFLNGYLYEFTGSFMLFIVSGGVAITGGLVFKGYQMAVKKEI
ncbi:MAG: MFS transporter [Deltaproteobacteria bacterium]|nr:MAG: MFS transporter [Deltaproteobacteria bacterium]